MSTVKFLCFETLLNDCQLQDSVGRVLSFFGLPPGFLCCKSPIGHRTSHPTSTSSAGSMVSQMEWIL